MIEHDKLSEEIIIIAMVGDKTEVTEEIETDKLLCCFDHSQYTIYKNDPLGIEFINLVENIN